MPKPRKDLTPSQLEPLYARINRLLDMLAVETQPRAAMRLLELSQKTEATLDDYLAVIRTDAALAGRMLRLANSALYAQRHPVTRLERALVMLGIERTKAIALGFQLSRAAAGAGARDMSRKVWGQGVYRACLASAMAKVTCPHLSPEAFVVGLMLDCGQPIMSRVFGAKYDHLIAEHPGPSEAFRAESANLEFTHVDLVVALTRRWKLPAVLAGPICAHHSTPQVGKTTDPCVLLQRLAYFVGSMRLGEGVQGSGIEPEAASVSGMTQRLFEVLPTESDRVVRAAVQAYEGIVGVFSDVAEPIKDLELLQDAVYNQLVELLDEQLQRAVQAESRGGTESVEVCGQHIEVEPGRNGEVIAYINGTGGQRMISCTVSPLRETPESVGKMLGLEDAPAAQLLELMRVMQHMAA